MSDDSMSNGSNDTVDDVEDLTSQAEKIALRMRELNGIERRVVALLQVASTTMELLGEPLDEEKVEERKKRLQTLATEYYNLLAAVSMGLRLNWNYLTETGIVSQAGLVIPYRANAYLEQKESEMVSKRITLLKHYLDEIRQSLAADEDMET